MSAKEFLERLKKGAKTAVKSDTAATQAQQQQVYNDGFYEDEDEDDVKVDDGEGQGSAVNLGTKRKMGDGGLAAQRKRMEDDNGRGTADVANLEAQNDFEASSTKPAGGLLAKFKKPATTIVAKTTTEIVAKKPRALLQPSTANKLGFLNKKKTPQSNNATADSGANNADWAQRRAAQKAARKDMERTLEATLASAATNDGDATNTTAVDELVFDAAGNLVMDGLLVENQTKGEALEDALTEAVMNDLPPVPPAAQKVGDTASGGGWEAVDVVVTPADVAAMVAGTSATDNAPAENVEETKEQKATEAPAPQSAKPQPKKAKKRAIAALLAHHKQGEALPGVVAPSASAVSEQRAAEDVAKRQAQQQANMKKLSADFAKRASQFAAAE